VPVAQAAPTAEAAPVEAAPEEAARTDEAAEPVEAARTGEAAEPVGVEPEELAPGDVPDGPGPAFWEIEAVDGYKDRWQQIQLRFIDDPRLAAEQAQALVGDVIQGLSDVLNRQRGELDRWRSAQLDDTEELRVTVRRYRDLLDRLFTL
jgi:hypothetical protein